MKDTIRIPTQTEITNGEFFTVVGNGSTSDFRSKKYRYINDAIAKAGELVKEGKCDEVFVCEPVRRVAKITPRIQVQTLNAVVEDEAPFKVGDNVGLKEPEVYSGSKLLPNGRIIAIKGFKGTVAEVEWNSSLPLATEWHISRLTKL